MTAILKCRGCGKEYKLEGKLISACENFGKDSKNHILEKYLVSSNNPFISYRQNFYAYHLASKYNVDYNKIITDIDQKLSALGEPSFKMTPLLETKLDSFSNQFFIKNETINVTGSHKARHMMGTLIYFEVLKAAKIISDKPKLAIYSCGNAALAASSLAKALGYHLDVFVPPNINGNVLSLLHKYEANVQICERREGEKGDPCYLRFQEQLKKGSIAFSCSGPDNWSNIEGGETLGLEMISQLDGRNLDVLVIQVGGGALASSTIKAFQDSNIKLPKIFAVQTINCHPLYRAFELIKKDKISLSDAAKNMSNYMWPWEEEPHSLAHGILDDITYDWLKILEGVFASDGAVIRISEDQIKEAYKIARSSTDIKVDYTGVSGLAGVLELKKLNLIKSSDKIGILFTGLER